MKPFFFALIVLSLPAAKAAPESDWLRAIEPRAWLFPRDHGAHPEFKTEWWYFTGNLANAENRPYGFQLTIFRQGLQRQPLQTDSQWAMRDFYFGHFTITDIADNQFRAREKVDRGSLQGSGASEKEMKVWLRNWSISSIGKDVYHLSANEPDLGLDVDVRALKPLVLEGKDGLSQKAPSVGNASYYYSYPRMATQGKVRWDDKTDVVQGLSWFDHEFSTSSLSAEQAGWDWFCLQLNSNEELMLYCMRRKDGSIDVTSSGTFISAQNQKMDLHREDFVVEPLAHWRSPHSGALYPSRWRIQVPKLKLILEIEPRIADQELNLTGMGTISYWEGACAVHGTREGMPVKGFGYTELTGYAKALGNSF